MSINNFERIKKFLIFSSEDEFYFLQILKRKKENPDISSNAQVIATYFVTSIEYLEQRKDEIKLLCDHHNARAYINLNRRSFESMAYHTLKKITDQIMNKDFKSCRRAYDSVAGGLNNEPKPSKKWVVDLDFKSPIYIHTFIHEINKCDPVLEESKIKGIIPTKNGFHLISTPFNVKQLSERVDIEHDIQKNNPTILYMPK